MLYSKGFKWLMLTWFLCRRWRSLCKNNEGGLFLKCFRLFTLILIIIARIIVLVGVLGAKSRLSLGRGWIKHYPPKSVYPMESTIHSFNYQFLTRLLYLLIFNGANSNLLQLTNVYSVLKIIKKTNKGTINFCWVHVPLQLVVVHQKLEVGLILPQVQPLPHQAELVQELTLLHLPGLGLMPTVQQQTCCY